MRGQLGSFPTGSCAPCGLQGAFSAQWRHRAALLVSFCDVGPCAPLITRSRRPPLELFSKRWNFQSTFFSCAHSLRVSTLVVCKQLFTHTVSLQCLMWTGRRRPRSLLLCAVCENHTISHLRLLLEIGSCHLLLKFAFLSFFSSILFRTD